ncbi:MAG: ABC transporter permease [Streptosporangiales bacterium]|nr:ABC transporter permease [Streptosporangiales bacterium]
MARPEFASLLGAVVVFVFFAVVADTFLQASSLATVLYASSTIGIMALAVALLMIGGEFDLSAGVAVTSSALAASLMSYQLTLNVWAGVLISLVVALAIGFVNGVLVIRTGLPSFIVTLAMFLMLTGLNLGLTKLVTGNVASDSVADMDGFASAQQVFAADLVVPDPSLTMLLPGLGGWLVAVVFGGVSVKITVLWWIVFVAIASWLLLRTRVGNWIFAVGGSKESARAVGVPVARTKIGLFMGVSFAAWFSGMHLVFAFNTVQSGEGVGNEFLYIIAAVIGGCLLTGGYGSAVGSAIGALIFGMANQGIVYAEWNPDWFKFFLGAMLLFATVVNVWVRKRVEASR